MKEKKVTELEEQNTNTQQDVKKEFLLSETEEKIKSFIDKSAKTSISVFDKMSNAVQNFSDRSVIKIERQQFKSRRQKKYEEMGIKLSTLLLQKNADILNLNKISADELVIETIDEIKKLQKEIILLNKDIKEQDKKLENKKSVK